MTATGKEAVSLEQLKTFADAYEPTPIIAQAGDEFITNANSDTEHDILLLATTPLISNQNSDFEFAGVMIEFTVNRFVPPGLTLEVDSDSAILLTALIFSCEVNGEESAIGSDALFGTTSNCTFSVEFNGGNAGILTVLLKNPSNYGVISYLNAICYSQIQYLKFTVKESS